MRDALLLIYRPIQPNDYEAVHEFLANNGWVARVTDAKRFRAMMKGADRTVVALGRRARGRVRSGVVRRR